MRPLEILSAGMVTPVGYTASASCAALRVGIDGFSETRFMFDGDWVRGGWVAYQPVREGRGKLLEMAVSAVQEAMAAAQARPEHTALLLCLPELERPGRLPGLDTGFAGQVRARVEQAGRLATRERVFERGTMGGIDALLEAEQLLARREVACCVVAGVDSYLTAGTLAAYHARRRILTVENSDGFLPGEAAAAVAISLECRQGTGLRCLGIGRGREPATLDSDRPLRADGLVEAYRAAFKDAGGGYEHLDYRLTDISGEQYAFKDAALALSRTMRARREAFDLWHPGDCVGRVGAAVVPLLLGVALAAARKGYAPGPGVLCHFSDDDGGLRAAAVLREHGRAEGGGAWRA